MSGCQLQNCNPFARFSSEQTLPNAPIKSNVQVLRNRQALTVRPGRVVLVASGRGNGKLSDSAKDSAGTSRSVFALKACFEVVVPDDLLLYGHSDNIFAGQV